MRENFSNCLEDFLNPDQVATSLAQMNRDNDVVVAQKYGIEFPPPTDPGQRTHE